MTEIFVTSPLTAPQAGTQLGYGHSDVTGVPYDFYTNVTVNGVTGTLTTGSTITMATNKIVVHIGATLAALTVNLPLNPPDGAQAEVSNSVNTFTITSLTVSANTSDSVLGTAVSATSTASGVTYRFAYSLNGDITKGVGPRSWVRTA
jgi:hypothetical protein